MIAWNKGLTKETDERVMRYASKGKDKKRLAHLGKKRSLQTKKILAMH